MEAKATGTDRLRGIEIERFRQMLKSEPFRAIVERVQAELGRAVQTCERADTVLEMRRAQGAAAALRVVLGLPERMVGEMKR